jgi:hypothetical protein
MKPVISSIIIVTSHAMVLVTAQLFTNKKEAVETVTPMKDEDGFWRVSGYYVKRSERIRTFRPCGNQP